MNKIKTLLIACSVLSLACSCADDPERHELCPVEQPFILYADQTTDSLCFYSYDSWSVVPQDSWIAVDGDSHFDVQYDYSKRYLFKVFLNILPNTTGETRSGTVLVQSYDYSYSSPFVQLGMLHVSHPTYTTDAWLDAYGIIPKTAHFELVDSAHWTEDSICFKVENNWTLEFVGNKPEWIDIDKSTALPGKHKVNLTLAANTDKENGREAKLKLTSGKVSNEIVVRQLPVKADKE